MASFSGATQDNAWVRVNGRNPCPCCRKFKGCLLSSDDTVVICLRIASDQPAKGGLGGWVHQLQPRAGRPIEPILVPSGRLRKAPPEILDSVYRALLAEHPLTSEHNKHLVGSRKLDRLAIRARGYKSWGSSLETRSSLARDIYARFGPVALDVPGMITRKQSGPEYVTLTGPAGIAIPIRDVEQKIIGIQIFWTPERGPS